MPGRSILLVEGKDDEHVVQQLRRHHGLGEFKIEHAENVTQLVRTFPVRLKESEVQALGVVVDADTNLKARWHSLCDHLGHAGYPSVPVLPSEDGTILEAPSDTLLPRVGVWLMPDNRTSGILEDFLRLLVPAPSPLLDHAVRSVDGIPAEQRRFSDLARPKALIHTLLAWQEKPGRPFGTAITARYLDADVPAARTFVDWLRRLFFAKDDLRVT